MIADHDYIATDDRLMKAWRQLRELEPKLAAVQLGRIEGRVKLHDDVRAIFGVDTYRRALAGEPSAADPEADDHLVEMLSVVYAAERLFNKAESDERKAIADALSEPARHWLAWMILHQDHLVADYLAGLGLEVVEE